MPNEKKHGWIRRRMWLILALVVIGGFAVFWFRRNSSGKDPSQKDRANAPVSVVTARVIRSDIGVYLSGLGTVTPLKTVTVRSRVDGQLMSLHFSESQLVKEGDLLAIIDPRPFEAQVEQAEGQLAKDQALLENARIDLERYRVLFSQDSIPKQQLDTQVALVRQYEAATRADRGLVDNARLQLRYSRVVAPITGKTGLRLVDQGNIVRATDATGLVVIAQLQPITVVFSLPEDTLPAVRQQMHKRKGIGVEAFDRAQKNRLATGVLTAIDNQVDTTTGTFKLKATFPNRDESLFPNQFVNIRMLVDTHRAVTTAPLSAIQRGAEGTYVYAVKEDGTATLRSVRTGSDDGARIEILDGIAPGDVVVVDGTDKLREGTKVAATSRDEAADSSRSSPGSGGTGDGKPGGAPRSDAPQNAESSAEKPEAKNEKKHSPERKTPTAKKQKSPEKRPIADIPPPNAVRVIAKMIQIEV